MSHSCIQRSGSIDWNDLGLPNVDPTQTSAATVSGTNQLDAFFKPNNVALIGATDRNGSVGRTILYNLLTSPFGGGVYPVNPTKSKVLGVVAYKTINNVPEQCDLAIICIPAQHVLKSVEECGAAGVRGLIIISAGFKEIGKEGADLEDRILNVARKYNMRIIGPNCLGLMVPPTGLNASFAACMSLKGHVGFLSQSGALMTSILDWTMREGVGFSAFISIGSMVDVDFGDLIYYLGDDPNTHSILIYMESIGNARSFLSAAREVGLRKPIVVIKPGRSSAAAAAAASHTGSLTGSDDVLTAAFERVGVIRVDEIDDLFQMANVLDKQPRPKGPNLTIISNAGGPGVIATDALVMGGGELTKLSQEVIDQYNKFLPPAWSHGNPVDILGDAPPINYAKSLDIAGKDPNTDAVLIILTPQSVTDCTGSAVEISKYNKIGKPVLASWMGGNNLDEGRKILRSAGIPNFDYPDRACRLFNYMWSYTRNLKAIYETPSVISHQTEIHVARSIIEKAYSEGRDLLTELESKQLLASYGIPTVTTIFASTAEEAGKEAEKLGYPIVLKLHSYTITHKTDVGGVQLNLRNKQEVMDAFNKIKASLKSLGMESGFQGVTVQPMLKLSDGYELLIGSSIDNQLGPVCVFGSGGTLVEVNKDRALALPPLNTSLANLMMQKTRIYKALQGIRGRAPCDIKLLEQILVNFSELTVDIPLIKEIDINPLLVSSDQVIALDARVLLHKNDTPIESIVKPAIRAYPTEYITKLGDIEVRPIKPSDVGLLTEFEKGLSEETVKSYFGGNSLDIEKRTQHKRQIPLCFVDYNKQIALVAIKNGVAVATVRISKVPFTNTARLLIVVTDKEQSNGIGGLLFAHIINVAKAERLENIFIVFDHNHIAMNKLVSKYGFIIVPNTNGDGYVTATKSI